MSIPLCNISNESYRSRLSQYPKYLNSLIQIIQLEQTSHSISLISFFYIPHSPTCDPQLQLLRQWAAKGPHRGTEPVLRGRTAQGRRQEETQTTWNSPQQSLFTLVHFVDRMMHCCYINWIK